MTTPLVFIFGIGNTLDVSNDVSPQANFTEHVEDLEQSFIFERFVGPDKTLP